MSCIVIFLEGKICFFIIKDRLEEFGSCSCFHENDHRSYEEKMDTLLFQRFHFAHPVKVEQVEKGKEILYLDDTTIIRADNHTFDNELPEVLSTVKLAERDKLLVTFPFHENHAPEQAAWTDTFRRLCMPLKSAWIWNTMRVYVPEVYMERIQRIKEIWEGFYTSKETGEVHRSGPVGKTDFLTVSTILYENPSNMVDFTISSGLAQAEWDAYLDALKRMSRMDPDPFLYTELPDTTDVPFTVRIHDVKGSRKYRIRII